MNSNILCTISVNLNCSHHSKNVVDLFTGRSQLFFFTFPFFGLLLLCISSVLWRCSFKVKKWNKSFRAASTFRGRITQTNRFFGSCTVKCVWWCYTTNCCTVTWRILLEFSDVPCNLSDDFGHGIYCKGDVGGRQKSISHIIC